MASSALTVIPTPNNISSNLDTIETMLDDPNPDTRLVKKMLRQAAANVRLLFELRVDEETGEFRLGNYGQAWMLADLLQAGDMVPSSYKSAEQVVIGLMKATEIKVSPISGLSGIMIVNNRPSVWGDLAQALVQRSGQITDHSKEEIGDKPAPGTELADWSLSYGWRVSFSRKGQETAYVREYTVTDSKRAGLWMDTKRRPWITDPSAMLFNRARARALRDGFSDCLLGMGIIEEDRDYAPEPLDGGDLKPAGIPSYLSDEPEQLTDDSNRVDQPLADREPVRDLGNDEDRKGDF